MGISLESLEKYSESPAFTQDTVPLALQRNHQTKAGVWGRLVVSSGALAYLRKDRPAQILTAGEDAVIFPEEPHFVTPQGEVAFKVEFYRAKSDGVPK